MSAEAIMCLCKHTERWHAVFGGTVAGCRACPCTAFRADSAGAHNDEIEAATAWYEDAYRKETT